MADKKSVLALVLVATIFVLSIGVASVYAFSLIDWIKSLFGIKTFSLSPLPAPYLTATAVSSSQINLKWTNPLTGNTTNSTYAFQLYRSNSLAGPYTVIVGTSLLSRSDGGLLPATTYYYKVRMYTRDDRNGTYSNIASATTFPVALSGPVVYYQFQNISKDVLNGVVDSSGNGYHGIYFSNYNLNFSSAEGIDCASALFDGVSQFNGNGQFILIDKNNLSIPGDLTLSFWIKVKNGNKAQRIIARGDSDGEYEVWTEPLTYGVLLHFKQFAEDNPVPIIDLDSDSYIPLNSWHQAAITVSGSAVSFYLDGQLMSSNTRTSIPQSTTGPTFFGGNITSAANQYNLGGLKQFEGMLDEVVIYKRALSADDILRKYNEQKPHLCQIFVGNSSADSLNIVFNSADEDKAGTWGIFGPGNGASGKPYDWNWNITLAIGSKKTIKSITLLAGREAWSSSYAFVKNSLFQNIHPYPLVIYNGVSKQLNFAYYQTLRTYNAGEYVRLFAYGQIEDVPFRGGTLTVYFTDGTSISATVPASNIVPPA